MATRPKTGARKPFALTTSKTFRGPNRTSNVNYREGKSSVNLRVHGSPTKVSGTYILGKRKIRL